MSDILAEARAAADNLRYSLPESLDVAALGVRSKAPFLLLCTREALIWRTEELARNVCDALERNEFAAAALLARAVIESAAIVWKLMEILDRRNEHSAEELHEILSRLFVGSRTWSELPQAFQILSCIDRVEKKVPGFRERYDSLSELAHPNWGGVVGLFSKLDRTKFRAEFGRGLRGTESMLDIIGGSMLGALEVFEHAYNKVSDELPSFLAELDQLWPENKSDSPPGDS